MVQFFPFLELPTGDQPGNLSCELGDQRYPGFRIQLEVVPLGAGRSFIHFSYSVEHGLMADLAMVASPATSSPPPKRIARP